MSSLSITGDTVSAVTQWALHRLGYPLVTVELTNRQLEYAFNESVEQFSFYIQQWALRNQLANIMGLPTVQDFTRRFVAQDFDFVIELTKAYSIQAGVGGDRPVLRDSFVLSAGTQVYQLPGDRIITEVLWQEPVAIDAYRLDPFNTSNFAVTEFGFSYMGNSLSYIVPVYWSLYNAQNFELKNKVRQGDFLYRVLPSSGGTNEVTLYPVPTEKHDGINVWYFYWDPSNTLNKYASSSPGENISVPSDVRLDEIPYSAMNFWSQMWIKKYTLAVCKETLGRIRGKFGSLKIPDSEVVLDANQLLQEGQDEQRQLIEQLNAELDKLDYSAMIRDSAESAESINQHLSFTPMGIWVG